MSEEETTRRSPSSVPVAAPDGASWAHPEIELLAREALARFGASGTLRVEGTCLVLYAPQGVFRAELGGLDGQWASLGEDARRRRTTELVRQLLSRRTLRPSRPPRSTTPTWVWPLVVTIAGGLAGWAAYAARPRTAETTVVRRAATDGAPPEVVEGETGRRQRAQRVCESARARVLRGATLGPAETEGWLVEVWALRAGAAEPLDRDSRLGEFVGPVVGGRGAATGVADSAASTDALRRFVCSGEPELAQLDDAETGVRVQPALVAGTPAQRAGGVRLSFEGALVDVYFRPEERVKFFHIASALSDRLEATHSAVVARCAGGATHHLGSWFRGSTPAEAATALLYVVGMYAEPPHLADPFLRRLGGDLDHGYALAAIREATRSLDQRALAELVGKSGGMITTPPGGPSVITFPFTDGNRASRASRDVARAVHLGRP